MKLQEIKTVKSGRSTRPCLQLSHLVELHPEVRHILPELQEVDFERKRAFVRRGRIALGSQDGGTTCVTVEEEERQVKSCSGEKCQLLIYRHTKVHVGKQTFPGSAAVRFDVP